MSTARDQFAEFDAAYVLGALSDDDRAAYERHLATCADCSAAVRALSPMPALLGTIPESALLDSSPTAPDTLLPRVLREVRRRRQRQKWFTGALAAAAAACLVLAGVLVTRGDGTRAAHPVAMQAVIPSPLHATADVREVGWGTSITLRCRYDATAYPANTEYSLVAIDRTGAKQELGTWQLVNGGVTTFQSGTGWRKADIAELQIRGGASSSEVLTLRL